MLVAWTANNGVNFHPIAHGGDFSKWDAGLHHAKRAGIHAQKHHALARVAEAPQILFMRGPGVIQRVVNVRDRLGKAQAVHSRGKFLRGGNEPLAEWGRFGRGRFYHAGNGMKPTTKGKPRWQDAQAQRAVIPQPSPAGWENPPFGPAG